MIGEVTRGSVYWVSVDDSMGREIMTGRPAVVISGDGRNGKSDIVVIAYLTSSVSDGWNAAKVKVWFDGAYQSVVCDQIRSIDKARLTKYMGSLKEEEMKRVTGALAVVMCIPLRVNTPDKQENTNEDSVALKVELDMMKRMYENVLNQLVEMKVSADISGRISDSENDSENNSDDEIESEDDEIEKIEDTPKVNLNTCTLADLQNLGVPVWVAQNIMRYRPYRSIYDLKFTPGMKGALFHVLKYKVSCEIPSKKQDAPKKQDDPRPNDIARKVNVNTATVEELADIGFGLATAQKIRAYRNKNGKFEKVEDLLNVPRFGKGCLEKYGSMLEV